MKTVVLIVLLFVGFFVAIDYLSKGTMAHIEGGLPGGGNGKFAEHKFPTYDESPMASYFPSWSSSDDSDAGAVTENPFSE